MIRTVTDPAECERLWETFSPHERAWDEWDLMFAFHDERIYRFHFLVHETDGRQNGLVPLVLDTTDNGYELFGGSYPDSRELWVRYPDFPEFFEQLPEPTVLFDLRGGWVDGLLQAQPQYAPNFGERDQRYFLVPESFGFDFYNHIDTFSGEKRRGFKYDLRKIQGLGPELRWSDDDEAELFIALCNRNFGAESDYVTEAGQQEVQRVVRELRESGFLKTLTITLDGVKQAVSLSALYKGTWIALYSISNNDIKGLGKFLNVETIQEASRQRVAEINYMTGMQWKAAWKMNSEACYTMRKPARAG